MELPKVRRLSFRGFHNPHDFHINREFLMGRDPFDDNWRPRRTPPVNIKKNSDYYELEMPLPGYKKEEVSLFVENDRLTVSGRREQEQEVDSTYLLREHDIDQFIRTFDLAPATDEDNISARFENGVLRIVLPHIKSLPYTGEPHSIAIM